MSMVLTERQWDWILGSVFIVLLVLSVTLAFWPESRRRHRRRRQP
jgi:ABC-type uncharacterized transport system permease subunit